MNERPRPLLPFSDLGLTIYNSITATLTFGALGTVDATAWWELQRQNLRQDEYDLIRYDIVTHAQELATKYVERKFDATQLEKVRDRIMDNLFKDNEETRNMIRKIFTDRIRELRRGNGSSGTQ